jgi:uncharacterized membrane protein YphA (DoxX/SURF4 family)
MATQSSPVQVTAPARNKPWALTAGLWVLQLGAAVMFLMAGGAKLAGAPDMVGVFEAIGMGQWFRYLTGAIEVGAALMLLVPSLAFYGAALLVPTMLGAIMTHLFILGGSAMPALVLLLAVGTVAWARRPR